jgi:hypothetical protein
MVTMAISRHIVLLGAAFFAVMFVLFSSTRVVSLDRGDLDHVADKVVLRAEKPSHQPTDIPAEREKIRLDNRPPIQPKERRKRPANDIDTPLAFIPKDPNYQALSPGQPKRGYEAMVLQQSKPLRCVSKSRWRGPNIKADSIETRLDYSLSAREYWMKNVTKAIDACGNGSPMMHDGEIGFVYHMLQKGDLMLEWGSGRSSCVWAQQVGELHSIEDSSTWVNQFYKTMNVTENQIIHWMPSFAAAGK